jgi:hypothetical protein
MKSTATLTNFITCHSASEIFHGIKIVNTIALLCFLVCGLSYKSTAMGSAGAADPHLQSEQVFSVSTPPDVLTAVLAILKPDGSASLTDGVTAQFGNFCDCVDYMDAPKFNMDVMFSLLRDSQLLCIERRSPLNKKDTLFLNLRQLCQRSYQFQFTTKILNNPGVTAHLEDSYTGTHTPLNTNGQDIVDFTIDANPASQAQDRFMVVFDPPVVLPTFSSIDAITQSGDNDDVVVQWTVKNEATCKHYEVQKSTDGINFSTIDTVDVSKYGSSTSYQYVDLDAIAGTNDYRVVSVVQADSLIYSQTASVKIANTDNATIIAYPNPVNAGGELGLKFINMPEGVYGIRLVNSLGQVLLVTTFTHLEGASTEPFNLPSDIRQGMYQIEVLKPDMTVLGIKTLVI